MPLAFADDSGIRHGAGVGTGQGASEGEAGDVFTAGQARQVMVTLRLGAVVQQQFGRAQGVGHHHGGGQVAGAGGQLHRHLGVGIGGKALAAVLLGDDQGEETVLLDMRPGLSGQVHLLADLPVTDHGAQRFGGPIDKRLLFFSELGFGVGEQGVPVRAPAEQLAIPPHCAGFNSVAFGGRHRRQYALEPGKQRCCEQAAALLWQQQW